MLKIVLVVSLCIFGNSICFSETKNMLFPMMYDKLKDKRFDIGPSYQVYFDYIYSESDKYIFCNLNSDTSSLDVTINSIASKKHNVGVGFSMLLVPFLRPFVEYRHTEEITTISSYLDTTYEVVQKPYAYNLVKYNSKDSFNIGSEVYFGYNINQFIPFLSFISRFGVSTNSINDSISYSLLVSLKSGTKYKINNNIEMSFWAGIQYFAEYYPEDILINDIIYIPQEYLHPNLNINNYKFTSSFKYNEDLEQQYNIIIGLNIKPHKNIIINSEFGFLNQFISSVNLNFTF